MTLDSTTSKVQYTQSGTTTAWPVPYKFLDNGDLIVITTVDDVDTTLVLDTDYTAAGAGDDAGGTVTISPAVAAGTLVTIYRAVDLDQPTRLTTAGGWYPTVHEAVFDRLTMQIQQVQEQADRSLKIGVTDTRDPEDIIDDVFTARDEAQASAATAEDAAIRAEIAASTVAYYNHEGTLSEGEDTISLPWAYDTSVGVEVFLAGVKQTESSLEFTDTYTVKLDTPVSADTPFEVVASAGATSELGNVLSASGGSASVGHIASGAGAVARTVQAKLRDFISVKDFGAVGDGTTDDTAAIQAALDYITTNGGTLIFPAGHVFALDDAGGVARPVGAGAGPAPAGTCTAKFTLTDADDITLTGGGTLKLLRTASGGGTYDAYNWHFFQLNSCSRVKVHGLTFIGNRTIPEANINYNGEQGEVFRLSGCTDVQITGNYFTLVSISSVRVMADSSNVVIDGNIAFDGNDCFVLVGDDASPAAENDPRDVVISNNIIDKFYTDAGVKVRYAAHNVLIDGNNIIAYQGGDTQNPPALMVRGKSNADDRVTDIVVSNNRIESIGLAAVSMLDTLAPTGRYPKNVTFIGNTIKGNVSTKGRNIKLVGNTIEGVIEHLLAADIDIDGNRIIYAGGGSSRTLSLGAAGDYAASVRDNRIVTNGTGHSIYAENITRLSVVGNTVEKNGTTTGVSNQLEIYVPENGDAVVAGNQFFQAASYRLGSCIRVNGQGANSLVSITGNTFRNAGAYSIRRAAALSGDGVVTGNASYGPTTADYLDSTGGYFLADNTWPLKVGTNVGNANATLSCGSSAPVQRFATALTAGRTVTLSTTGAYRGAKFRIVREAAATGSFNISVGTGPLKALTAAGQWCEVEYDGSAWFLSAYGTL